MQHSILDILIPWSFVLIVDLSVAAFFINLAKTKENIKSTTKKFNIEKDQI